MGERLSYPAVNGSVGTRWVAPGSVHDDLRRAGLVLSQIVPWKEHEAVWFLLTGEYPTLPSLMVRKSLHRGPVCARVTITIEAEPGVSAERVYRAYQHAQHGLSAAAGKPFEPDLLRLYRFVTPRLRGSEPRPTWDQIRREWIQKHPADAAKYDDFRPFRRDYYRTADRIYRQMIYPEYTWPPDPAPGWRRLRSPMRESRRPS
jgi:hypothetical protein